MGVPREDWCKECLGKRMVGVGVMPGKDGSDADGSIAVVALAILPSAHFFDGRDDCCHH